MGIEVWGCGAGLYQSLWGTVVSILLASTESSILTKWPKSIRHLFCIMEVRCGCSVSHHTSWLDTCWYQRVLRIVLRHHWSSVSVLLTSAFDSAQLFEPYSIISRNTLTWCTLSKTNRATFTVDYFWQNVPQLSTKHCKACSFRLYSTCNIIMAHLPLLKGKVDHAPVWSVGGVLISLSVAVEPVSGETTKVCATWPVRH